MHWSLFQVVEYALSEGGRLVTLVRPIDGQFAGGAVITLPGLRGGPDEVHTVELDVAPTAEDALELGVPLWESDKLDDLQDAREVALPEV